MMLTVGVMAGSTREGSYNKQLCALAARHLQQNGIAVERIDLADYPLPIFEQRIEDTAAPEAARALKARLAALDALVIAAPEYNGSLSALLKNAIDWSSRSTDGEPPFALRAWRGKPVAIMAASPGMAGGMRCLSHLRQILQILQAVAIPEQLTLPMAHQALSEGELSDELARTLLAAMLDRLVALASALKA